MRYFVITCLAFTLLSLSMISIADAKDPLLFTLDGSNFNQQSGRAVAGAGDVNNDGYDDIIVGAPYVGQTNFTGMAFVYSGKTRELLYQFEGEGLGDEFGRSVSAAGDVNSDGYADVIIGAAHNDAVGENAGRVYVYSGLDGQVLHILDGENTADLFGRRVSSAGDANGDGFADFLVGAPGNDDVAIGAGKAYIYSGKTGKIIHTFVGENEYDEFGRILSFAGDVDADGFGDVIIGAWKYSGLLEMGGRAYVYSGRTGAVIHVFDGEAVGDYLGRAVSSAGDVNNDGYDDLLLGTPFNDEAGPGAGKVYVFSGKTGSALYTFTGKAEHLGLGISVSSVGDINGDGYDDVAAGAYRSLSPDINLGSSYIYSGKDGHIVMSFEGERKYDAYGQAIAGAGDVNGDGLADIIVGAFNHDVIGSGTFYANGGRSYVYSYCCSGDRGDVNNDDGNANILDLTYLVDFIFRGGEGSVCAPEADVNGDTNSSNILDLTFLVDFIFRGGIAPGPC